MSVSVFPFTIVLISVVFDVMTSVFFRHMLYNCYRWDFEQGATFPWSHTIDSSLLRKMYGSSYGKQVECWCRLVKMQVFAGCRFQLHVLGTRRGQVSLLNFERPKNIVWFRSGRPISYHPGIATYRICRYIDVVYIYANVWAIRWYIIFIMLNDVLI